MRCFKDEKKQISPKMISTVNLPNIHTYIFYTTLKICSD